MLSSSVLPTQKSCARRLGSLGVGVNLVGNAKDPAAQPNYAEYTAATS